MMILDRNNLDWSDIIIVTMIYIKQKRSKYAARKQSSIKHTSSPIPILSIQRRPRRLIIQLNPTPLLMRRISKRQLPAPFSLRRRQPQPHKMSARRWRRMIRVRRPTMQHVRVCEELDIADFENHMQRQAHARIFKHLSGFHLRGRKRRDLANVAVAGEGFDVVGVPFAVDARSLVGPRFLVEDGLARVGFLAGGDFTLTIEVPDGLGEGFGDVRMVPLQGVPDVVHGDNVRLAALEGAGDAQQADDVAVVGVEELAGAGAVDADLLDLGRVGARVFDVAQDVAEAVLRDEVAEVGAEAHVGDGGLVVAPLGDGQAFEEEEAFAVDDVVAELV
jgi:hypothetical protein